MKNEILFKHIIKEKIKLLFFFFFNFYYFSKVNYNKVKDVLSDIYCFYFKK